LGVTGLAGLESLFYTWNNISSYSFELLIVNSSQNIE
jgi:hypothetical protein